MNDELIVKAPAKINLFLKVLGKRDDGYHNILSWFQTVSLYDILDFRKTGSAINLTISGLTGLPADSDNLVIKAAELMFRRYDLPGGLNIRLVKKIPIAAGLAGGSSDAAAVIFAIDKLYQLNLSRREAAKIGLELGSDIPFFFSSGSAEVSGRGEIVKDLDLTLDYFLFLIKPPIAISTKQSYQSLNLDLTLENIGVKLPLNKDFETLVATICNLSNDFEFGNFSTYPILNKVRDLLLRSGASLTRMSGSGPTVFGLFKNVPEGGLKTPNDTQEDWDIHQVRPVPSPLYIKE